jgi:hypothetical protein
VPGCSLRGVNQPEVGADQPPSSRAEVKNGAVKPRENFTFKRQNQKLLIIGKWKLEFTSYLKKGNKI